MKRVFIPHIKHSACFAHYPEERWRANLNEVQKKQQRTKPRLLQYNSYACRISEKTYSAHLKL